MTNHPPGPTSLIDAHCHLTDERLMGRVDEIINEAHKQGVQQFISCAASIDDWPKLKHLAEQHSSIIPAFGIHPWFINQLPDNWFEHLENVLTNLPHALLGEIGIDRYRPPDDEELEQRVFELQLQLAKRLKRPCILHCVRAWGPVMPLLRKHAPYPCGFMLHAYGGSAELVPELAELGAYFSFCGTVTNPNAKRVRNAITVVPRDRLLLETDAPDFLPYHHLDRTRANTPENLTEVLNEASSLLNLPLNQTADLTRTNTINFMTP